MAIRHGSGTHICGLRLMSLRFHVGARSSSFGRFRLQRRRLCYSHSMSGLDQPSPPAVEDGLTDGAKMFLKPA